VDECKPPPSARARAGRVRRDADQHHPASKHLISCKLPHRMGCRSEEGDGKGCVSSTQSGDLRKRILIDVNLHLALSIKGPTHNKRRGVWVRTH